MSWIRNAWYVGATSAEVGDAPLGRRLLGARMAFFRDAEGRVQAVEDFCPHRGAALSLGRVCKGELVCGYHGLVMGGDGVTRSMPGQRVQAFPRIQRFAVEERYGFIWVWAGVADEADPSTIPVLEWHDNPAWAYDGGLFHIMNNMLFKGCLFLIAGALILEVIANLMVLSNMVSEYLVAAVQGVIIILAMLAHRFIK